jgi:hypothetical protein
MFVLFRILALALIPVLLQAMFPSANCMAMPTHNERMSITSSNPASDDSEGDAGCCSYCACCHFVGVPNSGPPALLLVFMTFPPRDRNLLLPESSSSPFYRPPRA